MPCCDNVLKNVFVCFLMGCLSGTGDAAVEACDKCGSFSWHLVWPVARHGCGTWKRNLPNPFHHNEIAIVFYALVATARACVVMRAQVRSNPKPLNMTEPPKSSAKEANLEPPTCWPDLSTTSSPCKIRIWDNVGAQPAGKSFGIAPWLGQVLRTSTPSLLSNALCSKHSRSAGPQSRLAPAALLCKPAVRVVPPALTAGYAAGHDHGILCSLAA